MEAYHKKVVELAQNPGLLNSIKSKLAHKLDSTRLFDTIKGVRSLEEAYRQIWDLHKKGSPPQMLKVLK